MQLVVVNVSKISVDLPKIPATYISTSVIESQYIEIFRHIARKLPYSFSIQQGHKESGQNFDKINLQLLENAIAK